MEEVSEELIETEEIEETTEVIEVADEISLLTDIHNDLRLVCCFIVFFVLVIILKYIYKFFDMIFKF